MHKHRILVRRCSVFNSDRYLQKHPDLAQLNIDVIEHNMLNCANKGRINGQDFDFKWFLGHSDNGTVPLVHYISFGHVGARQTSPKLLQLKHCQFKGL